MPDIRPLRALRYDASRAGDLSRVLCPPYDVLSGAEEEALRRLHPRNFVRLILPRAEDGPDRYRAAAALLARWRADGTLRRDPSPAYYFYEQQYRVRGSTLVRRAIFALVRLHEFSERVVLPHERTMPEPREDRYRLIEASGAHLDAVFGLYSDPDRSVDRLFEQAAASPPVASASDAEGVAHRLWMTDRAADLPAITAALAGRWVLIADGHHRYESALRYARSPAYAVRGALPPSAYALMALCNIEARGLTVLPIHRLIHSLPAFDPTGWLRSLESWFERRELALPGDRELAAVAVEEALAPHRSTGGALVAAVEPRRAHLLVLRPGFDRERELAGSVPAPLRALDLTLAHTLILERSLSLPPDEQTRQTRLRYCKDTGAAVAELASGAAQAALFLNPTPVESIIDATRAGERLPPKSTFFYPKLISGMVIHAFDDGP